MQKEGSAGKSSIDRKDSNMGGGFGIRSGSAKEKRQLEGATTKFFVGTEVRVLDILALFVDGLRGTLFLQTSNFKVSNVTFALFSVSHVSQLFSIIC